MNAWEQPLAGVPVFGSDMVFGSTLAAYFRLMGLEPPCTPPAEAADNSADGNPHAPLAGLPGEGAAMFTALLYRFQEDARLTAIGAEVEAEINDYFAACRKQEMERQ